MQNLKVSDSEWEELKKIRDVLFDCFNFTKKMQSEQMTLADFYAEWVDLKLKLNKNNSHEFAINLVARMEEREENVHKNASILSALFLDSRYRVFLNNKPTQKQIAINHLTRLWKRINDLNNGPATNANDFILTEDAVDPDADELDHFLNALENNSNVNSFSTTTTEKIMLKLQNFDIDMSNKKRDPKSNHALDFWRVNGHAYPELHELAMVLFAAAPTETSVERNFSALTFILNKYRCGLSDENLSEILFIRLNKEIFYELV